MDLMSPRFLWQHVLCRRSAFALLAMLACALPNAAQAKDTLIWLLRDLPPLTIFDGPQNGLGAIDQLRRLLVAAMPEYEHTAFRVNRARAMQMLAEPSFTCDPVLLWTAERTRKIVFSIPSLGLASNGLVIRQEDRQLIEPFVQDGEVDLAALLASDRLKLGIVAGRSYGQSIDDLLQRTPAKHLTPHYGNDALGNLLQMQRLGRLSTLLGYWPEVRYLAQQQGIAAGDLVFYRLKAPPSTSSSASVAPTRNRDARPSRTSTRSCGKCASTSCSTSMCNGSTRSSGTPIGKTPGNFSWPLKTSDKRRTKETPRSGETTRG